MDDTKVTIIIPIYNTEAYLTRCMESVCNQTYQNLEIILINDGSTDNSLSLCRQYEREDSRIVVVNKENEGQGKARNIGLDMAHGQYILFVDSDDYIHLQMVEMLLKVAQQCEADIVQCHIQEVYDEQNNNTLPIEFSKEHIRAEEPLRERILCCYTDDIMPCNKMLKRELFLNNRFPEGMIYEDKHLMFRLRHIAKKIMYLDVPLYYYVQTPHSTMRQTIGEKQLNSFFRLSEDLLLYCEQNGLTNNYQSELSGYLRQYMSIYFQTHKSKELKRYSEKAIERLKFYLPQLRKNKYVVGKYKWLVGGLSLNFKLTMAIFVAMNKVRRIIKRI